MANTRIQNEVEKYIRENWMPKTFGQNFHSERLPLSSGGHFDFDAVSEDGRIAALISTSSEKTTSGKGGSGKVMKLHSDMLFLLLANVERRIIILTEIDMYNKCLREKSDGRVPLNIEIYHAEIPSELNKELIKSRMVAAGEVAPKEKKQPG